MLQRSLCVAVVLSVVLSVAAVASRARPAGAAPAAPTAATQPATRPAAGPHGIGGVVIISVDGLRPDVLLRAEAPHIRGLMARGAFTMWARTTPQSITLPSHVSMLTGVNPDVHGIQWNHDLPLAEPVWPSAPTLFEIAKRAGYTTAVVSGKRKLGHLAAPGTIDHLWITDEGSSEDPVVVAHAEDVIRSHRPDVLFVHFATVDNVGHGAGWGTKEQLAAIRAADACVGRVLAALEHAGRLDDSLVILTSDHGGTSRSHGPDDPRSRHIPWIAAGPGVKQNFDLTLVGRDYDVQTYDTFATACYALGLRPPRRVEGKPIVQMFERAELLEKK